MALDDQMELSVETGFVFKAGRGRTLTVKNLRDMVKKFRPLVIFLMETKMRAEKVAKVRLKWGFSHELVVELRGLAGGLTVWWLEFISLKEKGVKPFKFEANWVQHENFYEIVHVGWNGVNESSNDKVLELIKRLYACREKLITWSSKEFSNFKKLVSHLRRSLSNCYRGGISAEKLAEAEELVGQLKDVWCKEEVYWWQKSRLPWLSCGDRNTKFFHSTVVQRRFRNKVLRLKGENGVWLEEKNDIKRAFSDFYVKLFTSGGSRPLDQVLSYVDKVVTDVDNDYLMSLVSSQEIEDVVFQLEE
ncbi:hypothetical protein K1719_033589 [Acacia pycnantha]|nr:hypothetical protein K1719_033589 [Acacia pycnantha]